ncbi:MAG: carboxypeptidase M32, partial [Rubrobacteraceae bacterium]
MDDETKDLREHLSTISDLRSASGVLSWDRQTYMPPGGVEARAGQIATLSRLAHELLASPKTEQLIEAAGEPEPGSDAEALIRIARRDHERAVKLPTHVVEESSRISALSEPAWKRARETSDWSSLIPHMERVLELRREVAARLSNGHPYDALLDLYEPGTTSSRLQTMFDE